ncbi:hypothetical protein F5141DRAFT_725672 [Pisolithus sp. B1]|nr:hypothetical protein F5141DRAFT_725672 [Pisolithus sp. B1]
MKKRLAASSWPANQSMLDTQRTPQLSCEGLSGSFVASPQCTFLPHAANNVSWKIHETCNASNDKFLDTAGQLISLSLSRSSCEVISQSYIRSIVEKVIKACSLRGEGLVIRAEASQYLNNAFCRVPANITCLHPIVGQIRNIQVCVDEDELRSTGIPDAETFMKRMDVFPQQLCVFSMMSQEGALRSTAEEPSTSIFGILKFGMMSKSKLGTDKMLECRGSLLLLTRSHTI